jgi:hypothetical protein
MDIDEETMLAMEKYMEKCVEKHPNFLEEVFELLPEQPAMRRGEDFLEYSQAGYEAAREYFRDYLLQKMQSDNE